MIKLNNWPTGIDVIMLANTRDTWFQQLTIQTIKSLKNSEDNVNFNVVLIEDNIAVREQVSEYEKQNIPVAKHINEADIILYPDLDVEFGYNKYMNLGLEFLAHNSDNEYVVLANNDLLFQPGWWANIYKAMEDNNLLSACPISPKSNRHRNLDPTSEEVMFGYEIRPHLPGWCIVQKRKQLYGIIGKLDEDFSFWFCDNDYGNTLKQYGIKHGLVLNSHVQHLGNPDGPTINTTDPKIREKITGDHVHSAYCKKWNLEY